MKKIKSVSFVIAVITSCIVSSVFGVERTVPLPYPTIQSAIDASSPGDVVIIDDGEYSGTGNRDIFCNKAITIRSKNGKQNCAINCGGDPMNPHRGFCLSGAWGGAVIEGLSIYGGWASDGGGIYCTQGVYTIRDCSISGNAAGNKGGGIYCGTDSNPSIENCSISGNYIDSYSSGYGAGIYISNTIGSITGCRISSNDFAAAGGGIYATNTIPLLVSDCVITNNDTASGTGAGIYATNGSVTITDCEIMSNSDDSGGMGAGMGKGGGIALVDCDGGSSIDECLIRENRVGGSGGGIYMTGYNRIPVANCEIINNSAGNDPYIQSYGGGISCDECMTRMFNCAIAENGASYKGGGIYLCSGSSVELINCTLSENWADTAGPAIATASSSDWLLVTNSIVWNGTNGIYQVSGSSITINYSDIEGGWIGAGISNLYHDPLFVQQGPNYMFYPPWGDYHLQWSSPCTNQGDPNFPLPSDLYDPSYCQKDIDQEPREMQGRIDMGFDEVGEKQADFSRDGAINVNDLSTLVWGWLSVPDDENWYLLLDLYRDDTINFQDLAEFSRDWLWEADWY